MCMTRELKLFLPDGFLAPLGMTQMVLPRVPGAR
jgi:hypothetical protein